MVVFFRVGYSTPAARSESSVTTTAFFTLPKHPSYVSIQEVVHAAALKNLVNLVVKVPEVISNQCKRGVISFNISLYLSPSQLLVFV